MPPRVPRAPPATHRREPRAWGAPKPRGSLGVIKIHGPRRAPPQRKLLWPPSSSHTAVCAARGHGGPQPGDHAHATLRSRGPRSAHGRPSPLQPHPPGLPLLTHKKNCAPQPAPGGVVHTQGHSTSRQPPPPARSAHPCTRRTSLHLATHPLARCTSALLAYATAHAGLCGTRKQPSALAA